MGAHRLDINSIIGKTNVATNGMQMKIIKAYRIEGYWFVDVEFENGDTIYRKRYEAFKRGNISCSVSTENIKAKSKYLGMKSISNCGVQMVITRYEDANNITVEFEDGTVVYNKSIRNFKDGRIGHPKYDDWYRIKYLGAENINKQGFHMKVIDDSKGINNLTVQFDDGTIRKNVNCRWFREGTLGNPSFKGTSQAKQKHVGEETRLFCGLIAKIVVYNGTLDIDLELEDGTLIQHTKYSQFKDGYVAHPKYSKCEYAALFNGMKYFLCSCKKCKGKHMISLSEMKDFECTVGR